MAQATDSGVKLRPASLPGSAVQASVLTPGAGWLCGARGPRPLEASCPCCEGEQGLWWPGPTLRAAWRKGPLAVPTGKALALSLNTRIRAHSSVSKVVLAAL